VLHVYCCGRADAVFPLALDDQYAPCDDDDPSTKQGADSREKSISPEGLSIGSSRVSASNVSPCKTCRNVTKG